MNFPKIALKIEDRVYRLDATDGAAIKKMPKEDREQLLTLLAAVKKQHDMLLQGEGIELSQENSTPKSQASSVQASSVLASTAASASLAQPSQVKVAQRYEAPINPSNEKDIDKVMLRLIAEEKRNRPTFDKNKAYLYFGGGAAFILLILFLLI